MKQRIKVKKFDLKNPEHRAAYERILKRLDKRLKPITDAVRASQRITGADLATRINCKL